MESIDNNSGIVYVLTNPAMPGIVKIGLTERNKMEDRLKELYNTSVPLPFECEYACRVEDPAKVEKALHLAFGPQRVNSQREFFHIMPEQAIVILQLLGKQNVTPEIVKEYDAEVDPATKADVKKFKSLRRPPLNFEDMKIPIGSVLKYTESEEEVIVSSPRRVTYNSEDHSLTSITQKLLGLGYAVQPTPYWTFNGKSLQDIYNSTYTSNEE